MFSTHYTLKRLSRGIAAAALVAVLAAPAALARTGPYGGPNDPWLKYAVSLTARDTGGSAQSTGYRFVTDTLAPGGGIVSVGPVSQGFDWTDAGIGAASTVGLMLVLLGGTRLLTHRHRVLAV